MYPRNRAFFLVIYWSDPVKQQHIHLFYVLARGFNLSVFLIQICHQSVRFLDELSSHNNYYGCWANSVQVWQCSGSG